MKNIENIEYIEEYIGEAGAGLIGLLMAPCKALLWWWFIYKSEHIFLQINLDFEAKQDNSFCQTGPPNGLLVLKR